MALGNLKHAPVSRSRMPRFFADNYEAVRRGARNKGARRARLSSVSGMAETDTLVSRVTLR